MSRAIVVLVILCGRALADPAPQSPYELTGYGARGHIVLGAAVAGAVAGDALDVSVAPALGWFVAERFEVAAVMGVAHVDTGAQSATLWSGLVEPSYHLVLDDRTFAVLGMGVGAAYQHATGTALAVAPRVGLDVVLGPVVLSPAVAYSYVAHDALPDSDVASAGVARSLRLQIGVAAHW